MNGHVGEEMCTYFNVWNVKQEQRSRFAERVESSVCGEHQHTIIMVDVI